MPGRAAITGITQIDVTAMCPRVWNKSCFAQRSTTVCRCSRLSQLLPPRSDAVDDERDEQEAEVAFEGVDVGGTRAMQVSSAQECHPEGEPDREEELRHDRVGVTAIGVVVCEEGHGRADGQERADEVDEQHAEDGVPPELVE